MDSIMKKLSVLGLNSYESKCYLALVGKNELTATEIGKISGVPRSKVYDVLEVLSRRGLCNIIPGPVNRYQGAHPDMLKNKVENKLDKIREDIESHKLELKKTIETRDEAISILSDIFKKGRENNESLHYAEVVKDPLLVHRKICELNKSLKKEVLGFTRPPFTVPPEVIKEQHESEIEALGKNIIVRNIYQLPSEVEEIEEMIDVIKISEEDGEIAKVAYELPLKLFIFDEETVVYSLEDPILHKTSLTFSIVKHRSLAKFMKLAFESVWNSALDPSVLKDILNEKRKNLKEIK